MRPSKEGEEESRDAGEGAGSVSSLSQSAAALVLLRLHRGQQHAFSRAACTRPREGKGFLERQTWHPVWGLGATSGWLGGYSVVPKQC